MDNAEASGVSGGKAKKSILCFNRWFSEPVVVEVSLAFVGLIVRMERRTSSAYCAFCLRKPDRTNVNSQGEALHERWCSKSHKQTDVSLLNMQQAV